MNTENPYQVPETESSPNPFNADMQSLSGYRLVRVGFQLNYYCMGIAFLTILLGVFLNSVLNAGARPAAGASAGADPVIIGVSVLVLLALAGMFVGRCMCLTAPRTNERWIAIFSLVLFALSFIIPFVGGIIIGATVQSHSFNSNGMAMGVVGVLVLCGHLCNLGGLVLFLLFGRAIGYNIGSDLLVKGSHSAMTWLSIMIALLLAWFVTVFGIGLVDVILLSIFFGLTLLVCSLMTFLKFLRMCHTGMNVLSVSKGAMALPNKSLPSE